MHFGIWQGLSSQEIRQRDPETYAARRADPYNVAPEGAETWRQFYERAVRAVEEVLAATTATRVIIVTHSGVCTVLGLRAQGLDYTGKRNFDSHNCGIHTLAVARQSWRVVRLNDVSHLTSNPQTCR
jgi:broad specificity phosphatase PhoE